jgi:hypothetical protein
VDKPYVPSKDLGECLDVAVDHMMLAAPPELVHHDEPVLVVAAGQWKSRPKFES